MVGDEDSDAGRPPAPLLEKLTSLSDAESFLKVGTTLN